MLSPHEEGLHDRRHDDDGFTLIELLISITILGILMAAVSAAMMVGLRTNESTGERLDQSRDEQFIAAYFSGDVNGANTFRGVGGIAVAPGCNVVGGGGTLVVEFVGDDFTDTAAPAVAARTVSYIQRITPAGQTELHRMVCTDGATVPGPGNDTTMARSLTPLNWAVSCINPAAGCVGVTLTSTSGDLTYSLTAYKRTT